MADQVTQEAPTAQDREPALLGMLLRDATLMFAALAIWGGADAWAISSGLALALVTAVATALIAGWVIASLLHEWGHYLGAKLARSKAQRINMPGLLSLRYTFDLEKNSLGQFTAMGVAGNIAHWGVFVAALLLLPMSTLAQTAFVSATLAFAIFGSIVEWPIIARTLLRKVEPIQAFAHINGRFLLRHQVYGGVVGLAFLGYLQMA